MVNKEEKEEKDKKIDALKKLFTITNAAFDFVAVVNNQFGATVSNGKHEKMKELHKECLDELNKEAPDLGFLERKVFEMEILASQPLPPKNFKKGGI